MQGVNVQTTQNVAISYQMAGLADRIWAYLLDVLVLVVYFIAVAVLLSTLDLRSSWALVFFYLPVFFYHLISEIFFNGQSIGKKQMKIKVVRLDGTSPTLGGYILRWILRPIDISLFSGAIALITIAVSSKGQRLGDMAAGTTVIKIADPNAKLSSHQLIHNIEDDYQPTYSNVTKLTDHDITIIQEALEIHKTQANVQPVLAVTEKVKTYLEVTPDMPPIKFLYTIIKDYNYYHSQS